MIIKYNMWTAHVKLVGDIETDISVIADTIEEAILIIKHEMPYIEKIESVDDNGAVWSKSTLWGTKQ